MVVGAALLECNDEIDEMQEDNKQHQVGHRTASVRVWGCFIQTPRRTVRLQVFGLRGYSELVPSRRPALRQPLSPSVQPERASSSNVSTQSCKRRCDSCQPFADDQLVVRPLLLINDGPVLVSGHG